MFAHACLYVFMLSVPSESVEIMTLFDGGVEWNVCVRNADDRIFYKNLSQLCTTHVVGCNCAVDCRNSMTHSNVLSVYFTFVFIKTEDILSSHFDFNENSLSAEFLWSCILCRYRFNMVDR